MKPKDGNPVFPARQAVVLGGMGLAVALLLWRAVDLNVFKREFLQHQGDARHLRVVSIAAHRGMITDRYGEPLAISTPMDSVWADPGLLAEARESWPVLARLLGMKPGQLAGLLARRMDKEFIYLRRHVTPEVGRKVTALEVPGVYLQREYRRYYPTGEVFAHVLGFTDVDDRGQEGLELLYDDWLHGTPGSKRVIKDRLGRIVENVESISAPSPGKELRLSLDRRLQYLGYRELKAAIQRHHARAGSLVLLDSRNGEVLAMVNQPAFNPNNRRELRGGQARNRAVTDVFEPGSTVKPFVVAAALESGRFRPDTPIDTSPGVLRVGRHTVVRDIHNYGRIDVTRVIQKSSNVGASLIALALEPKTLWGTFEAAGFGLMTGSGFPGEATGLFRYPARWRDVERATLSFGYGLSVTALQLVRAYAALAGNGDLPSVKFLPAVTREREGAPFLKPATVRAVRAMLEKVVEPGGTATRAAVPGYRVAGKTGTVRKVGEGGYSKDRHEALFVGMAPASRPRLVMVVVIDEPQGKKYYGGQVAAPVFSRVMAGALRLLDIPPDDLPSLDGRLAAAGDFL